MLGIEHAGYHKTTCTSYNFARHPRTLRQGRASAGRRPEACSSVALTWRNAAARARDRRRTGLAQCYARSSCAAATRVRLRVVLGGLVVRGGWPLLTMRNGSLRAR